MLMMLVFVGSSILLPAAFRMPGLPVPSVLTGARQGGVSYSPPPALALLQATARAALLGLHRKPPPALALLQANARADLLLYHKTDLVEGLPLLARP